MENKLDKFQQSVVNEKNDILVIAGPGSGKTTTISYKVKKILETNDKNSILLISFTNKSIEDIKRKINEDIFITTFHKLAIDILKYNKIDYKISEESLLDFLITEYFLSLNDQKKKYLCNYLGITTLNKKTKEFDSLKRLIASFINICKANNINIKSLYNKISNYDDKYLVSHIIKIYYEYEIEKKSTNSYDFDDLIVQATNILNKKYNYRKFKYIIIDEFQDTSLIRLNLIKIIKDKSKAVITVVGDDAQSIYHFSGCDLNIIINFQKYFNNSKLVFLKNTYRNSKELVKLTENFINKNPLQIKKDMISNISIKNPIEKIFYINSKTILKKVIDYINSENILILGRNKNDIFEYIDNDFKYENDTLIYKDIKYRYLTIHSAKGLENDYVILLNVSNRINGIPNKIENHPIINYIFKEDDYPYSEERRIFFVALTRCKIKTFLLIPRTNPSVFIKEI